MEVANFDITNVPEHEWHWPARTGRANGGTFGLVSLVPIPNLAVAIDATRAVAIDSYVITS